MLAAMADLFVCYSGVDGRNHGMRLADALIAGPPPFPVWLDKRRIQPGQDWDVQIDAALRTCRAVLFVMTVDSVRDESVCKNEWVRALSYKKPVIPLLFDADALLPFRLNSRQYLEFTGSFEVGLAQLRRHLEWSDSPEGVLAELRFRLADANRELDRAPDERRARVAADIAALQQQIADQERVAANPAAATASTAERIKSGLLEEQKPATPIPVPTTMFVNPPPMVAPAWFQDRQPETEQIGRFLTDETLRMHTVVGRGGVGKTATVCRVLKALEAGHLPDSLGPLQVGGIVYLSKTGRYAVGFENLYDDLCVLLPPEQAIRLRGLYRDPQQTPAMLMEALLDAFPTGPVVVLLDNFEDLVDPLSEVITDAALAEALATLLAGPAHGLKVIITTQMTPRDLADIEPARQWRRSLDDGLASPFAEQVLRYLDDDGSLGMRDAPAELLDRARERTRGYPKALEALKSILLNDGTTTLAEVLDQSLPPDDVVEILVGEAFDRLDPLASSVMEALAIFPVPVPLVAIDYLLQPQIPAISSRPVLRRLVNAQLVRVDQGRFHLHPIDRAYARGRIPEAATDNADPSFTRRSMLLRAADYFVQTRTPRDTWRSLDDLAAQLAEFELRFEADDYDNASAAVDNIDSALFGWGKYRYLLELRRRLDDHLTSPVRRALHLVSLGKCSSWLGEYSTAIENFKRAMTIAHEIPDRRLEGSCLGGIGVCFFNLGDYTAAIENHRQALGIAREILDREQESAWLLNLGNCYLDLGDYPAAIESYTQGLGIACDIDHRGLESACLGNLGVCYFSVGDYPEAVESFEHALGIARDTGDRQLEGNCLGNLALFDPSLGDDAILEHHTKALDIAQEIGDRYMEANVLGCLADIRKSKQAWTEAIRLYDDAIAIADGTRNIASQAEPRCGLAETRLLMGNPKGALQVVEQLRTLDYPARRSFVHLVEGLAYLTSAHLDLARQALSAAIAAADAWLRPDSLEIASLDIKAVALAGLALRGEAARVDEAITTFGTGRRVGPPRRIVDRRVALLDLLGPSDHDGLLDRFRQAASRR